MSHDPCPVCNESETTINEIDQSICCINCGTVLEAITLQQFYEVGQVVSQEKKEKQRQKLPGLKERWEKVAVYYGLGEDIRIDGDDVIDRHHGRLPYRSENFNEICLALVCSLGKHLRPQWTYDDYINLYPESVLRPVVIKYYHLFEGNEVGTYLWKDYSDNQIRFTLNQVYDCITKQLFVQNPIPDGFNLTELVRYTKTLLKLGSTQGINSGKKARGLIPSVACICALYLRSAALSHQHTVTKKRKIISTSSSSQQKVKKVDLKKVKQDLLHLWNFTPFSKITLGVPRTFKATYDKYISLLVACTKKMPWIEQPVPTKDIFFHLEDILEAFGQKGDEPPMMKLSLEEFAPQSYIKNRNEDSIIVAIINRAKELNQEEVEEENLLVYYAYLCLEEGYAIEEMERWTVGELRRVGEAIRYRKMFPLREDEIKNIDLNRERIDTDDMGDNELASYIPISLI